MDDSPQSKTRCGQTSVYLPIAFLVVVVESKRMVRVPTKPNKTRVRRLIVVFYVCLLEEIDGDSARRSTNTNQHPKDENVALLLQVYMLVE